MDRADADALPWERAPEFQGLEPMDRALAERLHRGVLQNLRLLDFMLDASGFFDRRKTRPEVIWTLRLFAYERVYVGAAKAYSAVDQAVELAKAVVDPFAAKFVNAVARKLFEFLPPGPDDVDAFLARLRPGGVPPAIRFSFPDDLAAALAEGFGAEALPDILRAMNGDETRVWLRANALRATPEKLAADLAAGGTETEPAPGVPGALRWLPARGAPPPWRTQPWARGEVTVQDLGAMLPALALAPRPGEVIIDWCAAPGGKTGQLIELADGRARIAALEVSPGRRRVLEETLERLYGGYGEKAFGATVAATTKEIDQWLAAGAAGARVGGVAGGPTAGAGQRPAPQLGSPLEATPALADAILVDAPCLALGLARRRPSVRWDGRLRRVGAAAALQLEILRAASARLAPGGRLVYATCSPTRAENEGVVEALLREDAGLELGEVRSPLAPELRAWVDDRAGFLRTRPDKAPVDAFAFCLIRRVKG